MTSSPRLVRDVMTRTVVSVTPLAEFKQIVAVMKQWRVTAVPVVEGGGEGNRAATVIGVVSEADLLPKEEFRDHDPGLIEQMRRLGDTLKAGSTLAKDLMTAPAVTVRPDATLAQAARLMAERNIKRLLVVDPAGTLQGIVSRTDLLKVFLRPDSELADEKRREVVGRLFPLHSTGCGSTSTTAGPPSPAASSTPHSFRWQHVSHAPWKAWSTSTAR